MAAKCATLRCVGNRHIDQRARDGDQKLLARLFRDARQPRHAADRQQGYIGRLHSERTCREDMAELVSEDAGKHQDDEDNAVHPVTDAAGRGPALQEEKD